MKVRQNEIVPLGYGKFCRAEKIVGLEPIEMDRGPARRTLVFLEGLSQPIIASRSGESILRDMVEPEETMEASMALDLLEDMLHAMEKVGPMLRRSIRDEAGLDIDEMVVRIRKVLGGGRFGCAEQAELF